MSSLRVSFRGSLIGDEAARRLAAAVAELRGLRELQLDLHGTGVGDECAAWRKYFIKMKFMFFQKP